MSTQTIRESLMNEGTILTNEQMGFVKGGTNSGHGGGKSGKGKSKKAKSGKKGKSGKGGYGGYCGY